MTERRCCVCDEALAEGAGGRLGRRSFCANHLAQAEEAVGARFSRMGLIETGAVVLFVVLIGLTMGHGPQTAPTSVGLGVLLALVPTLLLLVYIYRLDRLEPEPPGVVFGVFVLGALLGYAVVPLVGDQLLEVGVWQQNSIAARWVAAVLVVGTLQELCKYLAVRYTVYLTDEFDEPIDGVVYVTAAGLGVATVVNVSVVVEAGGVLPLPGATAFACTALVHVAAAVVLGYGMGRARFGPTSGRWWLAFAFILAVVVNGGLSQVVLAAGIDGSHFRPWVSLAVAVGLCTCVLVAGNQLEARLRRRELQEAADAPE